MSACGARNGSRRHPERLRRGAHHWTHTHPEKIARGERQGLSRLTDAQVVTIRRRYAGGETQATLARAYAVNQKTMWAVVTGRTWTHVGAANEVGTA